MSYISLNTTLASQVEGQKLKVDVSVSNKGNESAFNVQAEIRAAGKEILVEKKDELTIGSSYLAKTLIPLSLEKPGTYPLTLIMHYTDGNQYPFSSLTCKTFSYKSEATPEIFGQLKSTQFSESGTVKFRLKNSGDNKIRATAQLVLSHELTVKNRKTELIIGPRSEKSLDFEVSNVSALAGSTYQAFAITEYGQAGLHLSVISPGTISIVEKSVFNEYQIYFYSIIAILLILFVVFQFKK